MVIKTTRPNKSQNNYKKHIEMQFLSVFPDITKIANFRCKFADISRTQGV